MWTEGKLNVGKVIRVGGEGVPRRDQRWSGETGEEHFARLSECEHKKLEKAIGSEIYAVANLSLPRTFSRFATDQEKPASNRSTLDTFWSVSSFALIQHGAYRGEHTSHGSRKAAASALSLTDE